MAALGVRFYNTVAADVPERVSLDALRIRQVLANGVTNALKYTPSGEVRLHVGTTTLPTGVTGLLFQVMNTGPGLRGRDFRTLFDPLLETGTAMSLESLTGSGQSAPVASATQIMTYCCCVTS